MIRTIPLTPLCALLPPMNLAHPPLPRLKPVAIVLVIVFALMAGGALHAVNRSRLDLETLQHRTREVVERAEALAVRAASFDHEQALRNLGTNPINGPAFRFDERWRDAGITAADDLPYVCRGPSRRPRRPL
jgi:hypothetical protein